MQVVKHLLDAVYIIKWSFDYTSSPSTVHVFMDVPIHRDKNTFLVFKNGEHYYMITYSAAKYFYVKCPMKLNSPIAI